MRIVTFSPKNLYDPIFAQQKQQQKVCENSLFSSAMSTQIRKLAKPKIFQGFQGGGFLSTPEMISPDHPSSSDRYMSCSPPAAEYAWQEHAQF